MASCYLNNTQSAHLVLCWDKTWTYAIMTLELCQDRKVAAIRDAYGRLSLRVAHSIELIAIMPGFGDIVKKAFYIGVGIASYAGEKTSNALVDLQSHIQKLADEMVVRGEMNTEEARLFIEDMMRQAQKAQSQYKTQSEYGVEYKKKGDSEPRHIEILDEGGQSTQEGSSTVSVYGLRKRVLSLQEELKRLQGDK